MKTMPNKQSRREFLARLGLTTGAFATGIPQALAARAGRKIPIGLQLYAVRGEFSRDVPGTLEQVAKLGYRAVEFWGYGGTPNVYQKYTAQQLRQLLDQNRLRCCGMHLQLRALEEDRLQQTIEANRILGNRLLIVAAAREKMRSEATIHELAEFLNRTAERVRSSGMRVGYHAHPFDFAKIGDRFAWDILFSQTKPEVVMQMDVGNCLAGGGDPIAMLKKFPGRALTIHIKEYEDKTFDSDYYKEVFKLCETTGGTRWYVVEMGGPGGNGFDIPRQALAKLQQLGK